MTISNQDARQVFFTTGGLLTYNFTFPVHAVGDITVIRRLSLDPQTEVTFTDPSDYSVALSGSPLGSTGGIVTLVADPLQGNFLTILLDPPRIQSTSLPVTGKLDTAGMETTLDKFLNIIKRAHDLGTRGLRLSDGSVQGFASLSVWDALLARMTNLGTPTEGSDAATKAYTDAEIAAASITPYPGIITSQAGELLDDTSFDAMLTTLGGLAVGIALFKSASPTNAMNNLGMSAFFQTLTPAADAPAFQALIESISQLGNMVVNGDAQVWQNGEAFLLPTDASYVADQFVFLEDEAGTCDVSRMTSTFPDHAKGGIFVEQQIGKDNKKWALMHIIESSKVIPMHSKKVSLSVDVLSSGNLTNMELHLLFWAGTADAPTLDPISAWNAAEVAPTIGVANWDYVAGSPVSIVASATWKTFKLEDITVPGTATNLAMLLVTDDPVFTGSAVIRTTNWKLVVGSIVPQFTSKSYQDTLRDCWKFFYSTFPENVKPAEDSSETGYLRVESIERGANTMVATYLRFPVPMLKVPTMITYNPDAANANWVQASGATERPPPIPLTQRDKNGCNVVSATTAATTAGEYNIHVTADARY